MINTEIVNGVQDIVKSILGVKSQNAEILLTTDSKIVFRTERTMMYVIDTPELFNITENVSFKFDTFAPLDNLSYEYFISAYNSCIQPMNLVLRSENLQEDPRFIELTELKSKDGIGFYNIFDNNHNIYKIPMYTGFVKFNKGDKADIEIYDYPNSPYWMNKFIVRKKKLNYPIQVYFLTLKL